MPTVLLFAQAREAAGTNRVVIDATTVDGVVRELGDRFGEGFVEVLESSRIWCNGEPADGDLTVAGEDELAVLPPVSGG